jgi:hypothetical protein
MRKSIYFLWGALAWGLWGGGAGCGDTPAEKVGQLQLKAQKIYGSPELCQYQKDCPGFINANGCDQLLINVTGNEQCLVCQKETKEKKINCIKNDKGMRSGTYQLQETDKSFLFLQEALGKDGAGNTVGLNSDKACDQASVDIFSDGQFQALCHRGEGLGPLALGLDCHVDSEEACITCVAQPGKETVWTSCPRREESCWFCGSKSWGFPHVQLVSHSGTHWSKGWGGAGDSSGTWNGGGYSTGTWNGAGHSAGTWSSGTAHGCYSQDNVEGKTCTDADVKRDFNPNGLSEGTTGCFWGNNWTCQNGCLKFISTCASSGAAAVAPSSGPWNSPGGNAFNGCSPAKTDISLPWASVFVCAENNAVKVKVSAAGNGVYEEITVNKVSSSSADSIKNSCRIVHEQHQVYYCNNVASYQGFYCTK